jgi:hypothetical protein
LGSIGLGLFLLILLSFLMNSLKVMILNKQFVYLAIFIVTIVQNLTETRIVLYIPIYWYFVVFFFIELKLKLSKDNFD